MHNSKDTRIIFLGTPDFAIPSLEALLKANYSLVAVVTRPDEPVGRDQVITPPPAKVFAQSAGILVFQPEKLSLDYWIENIPEADCMIVAAYGKLIPGTIIGKFPLGALNVHPSLLPRLRGPSPIQSAILNGEKETGISIILLDDLMDHGPILGQTIFPLFPKIGYRELHDFLAKESAGILINTFSQWIDKTIQPIPQNDDRATYSKILKKDDGRVNWSRPAEEIERMVRALEVWPGSWSIWATDKKIYRIRIEEADTQSEESPYGSPGHVWKKDESGFPLIKTGKGSLVLRKVTIEGKKALSAQDLLRGYPQFIGTTLV